jgi:DNA-binding Xre family transcriptional regulator
MLWLGYTERIDFGTLDRLCRALGAGVGDLFQSQPEETGPEMTKPTR